MTVEFESAGRLYERFFVFFLPKETTIDRIREKATGTLKCKRFRVWSLPMNFKGRKLLH